MWEYQVPYKILISSSPISEIWLDWGQNLRKSPNKFSANLGTIIFLSGSGAKYCYDRFPSNNRTEEQEEKRKQILATASGALDSGKQMSGYADTHVD